MKILLSFILVLFLFSSCEQENKPYITKIIWKKKEAVESHYNDWTGTEKVGTVYYFISKDGYILNVSLAMYEITDTGKIITSSEWAHP